MRKMFINAVLLAGSIVCAWAPIMAAADEFAPFGRGSFAEIRKAHAGRPLVVHFWSVTCPACVAELGDWTKILAERPNIDVVFVNTDGETDRARVTRRLQATGLTKATHFAFADQFVERLYFEVDRTWGGELPFTALIDAKGETTTVIGVLDDPQIKTWLASRSAPAQLSQ
jgi:thiol-disulfide isomerase/thioredoxin